MRQLSNGVNVALLVTIFRREKGCVNNLNLVLFSGEVMNCH
jgi:hypothetical protein